MRKHLARLAVVAVSAGALTAGLAAPAQAAAGCSGAGPVKPAPYDGQPLRTKYCNAYRAGTVFGWYGRPPVGYLYRGRSWFVCQAKGSENPAVGRARNHWWLWTLADDVYPEQSPGYGWFPATYISGGNNNEPVPGLQVCPT